MALEQEQLSITFIEGSENIRLEPEEVKITPPARRKKAEKMKNKAGRNSPLSASDVVVDGGCSNNMPEGLPAEVSLNQGGIEDTEPPALNNEVESQGDAMNSEKCETKNEVLTERDDANDSTVNCDENSCVESNDLAAYANDPSSMQSSNENEEVKADLSVVSESNLEDLEFFVDRENSRESCISPDISANASHDEELFFSAEEADTCHEIQSTTLHKLMEVVNETATELERTEDRSSVNEPSEDTNTKEETVIVEQDSCKEISETQIDDNTHQTSTLEALQESLENTPDLQESTTVNLSAETAFIQSTASDDVCDVVRVADSVDTPLSDDTDLGAIRGAIESDSDTDEEWSSSSYSSSEGEYDIDFAEQARGIQELDEDSDEDFRDKVEEILSAFPANFSQVVNVTDSEDDSNKGDSLNNTAKTTEDFVTENEPSPLNIMGDYDEIDAGKQILSSFPQSECPVIVDVAANDSGLFNTDEKIMRAKDVEKSSVDERTSANGTATVEVTVKDSDNQSTEEVSATDTINNGQEVSATDSISIDLQSVENISVRDATVADQTQTDSVIETSDQENEDRPVKRTGSFRLINNNGVLKVVDSGETPVTTENVKEARLLKTKSLKGVRTERDDDQSDTDSTEARKQLDITVTEAKTLDKEFENVCNNIATLDGAIVTEGAKKTVETENEENNIDMVDGEEDSSAVIIRVNSMSSSAEQRPTIKLEGVTENESTTDEREESAREAELNGTANGADSSSTNNIKKQRPKKLLNTKRYSLDTEPALLSPEDENHVELTNFGSNNSIKSDESAVSSTSDSQTDILAKVSTDGQQQPDDDVTPSPPPRVASGRHKTLSYSGSFNHTATRPTPVLQKEGSRRLPKRSRSERSKTLPNNVFDAASDKFSRLFTSSSPSEPVHQGPITLITDNMPATFTGFPINRRAQVALELYTTERSYVRGLETILQLFKKPCEESKLLEKKEVQTMFSNIQDIYLVNKDVLFMLLERVSHWSDQQCLGDIFADQSFKIIDRMKIYAKYCNNYDSAEALYKQKLKKKEFESFVNSCYEHTVCQPGLNLPAYLITVVQRIPRYLLLLEDISKRTPENHPDHGNLSKALTKMGNLAVYINNQLQTTVGQKAMMELRSRVIGLKAFEVPGRALIKEADVVFGGSKKTRKCLLFNDLLVFAVKGATKTSEVEQTIELVTLWCMDLEGNNPQSAKDDSLEIYTPEQSYILDAGTKNEKRVWLQKLRTRIAMALHGAEATEKNEIESRKANFTYKDGRIFSGNFVSGKRHGEGTMSWPNQARYQGLWEDDERNGWGELTYNSGDKYRGEWLDDKQHGVGTMEYTSGDIYHGEWYMGDMHGQGRITFKNGDQVTGDFIHNEIEGHGELRCVSELTYKGQWKHSKKHGKGKMQFPNGDVYSGQFANDRISGQGDMQYANGSVYKGQWVDSQRGGHGEFSGSDGTHYVGGWSGDHITGKGRMTYSNGDCYDGNWFKNTRFGQGVMKYSNGDVYEGVFEYDLRSKHGKMAYKDGSVYEGCWANGLRHGKGKMLYSDKKSKFEGEWMLGLRHGEGMLTFANGASYTGHWEFDKQNGRGMYNDPASGYRYEGEWQNGLKHGKGVEQTTEGTYEGEWKDNMRHGQGREILSCETEFEGRWKENRKHGAGIKKLKTGRMEEQVWREGKHVDVSSVVVTELPLIQRR